jgi:hypothetical protein
MPSQCVRVAPIARGHLILSGHFLGLRVLAGEQLRATAAVVLHYFDFDPCAYSSTVANTPGNLSPHMASMHNPMSLVDAHAFFGDSSL